jgi:hypothetical protein
MDFYVTSHLSNRALRIDLKASDSGECRATAVMLSRLGEFDERKLFLEDGYPSMRSYCMGELNYSEDKASKRIYAARTARKLPVLFLAVADGRLNLSGVVMLAKYLTLGNVGELVAAASRKTREQIALLIAERFPRPDLPERFETLAPFPPLQDSPRDPGALFPALLSTLGSTNEDSPGNPEALLPTPAPSQAPSMPRGMLLRPLRAAG